VKKIVIFGAGRIGRSFIGQIFSRGGYEVIFIDINKNLIDLLNKHNSYKVIIKGEKEKTLTIKNVRGIHFDDKPPVIKEILSTSILAVSAGQAALPAILPCIAESLDKRYKTDPGNALDIIIAENMRNGTGYFRDELHRILGENFPVDRMTGLIETSIGKMVPFMTGEDLKEDPLQIFAESYNTLILDKKGFRNPIPDLPWLSPKENMKAWVDRKSFIHNLGHAASAYTGFIKHPEKTYLFEILEDQYTRNLVRSTMLESAEILLRLYPAEFSMTELKEHTDDLLHRFRNRALKDTVFRIGCDLTRKLGPDDRMVSPIREAIRLSLSYEKILYALVCGFYFRVKDNNGKYHPADELFYKNFTPDIEKLFNEICKFDPGNDKPIILKAKEYCKEINRRYKPEVLIY
jgi:mannitol-1-phosphate 5-dehydrogenase